MHVKPAARVPLPIIHTGAPAFRRVRRAAGGGVLVLTVGIEAAVATGLAAVTRQHFTALAAVNLAALLSIYLCASLVFAFRARHRTWNRDRRTLIVALVIGISAAAVPPHLSSAIPVVTWFVLQCAASLVLAGALSQLEHRASAWSRPIRSIAFIGNSHAAARMVAQLEAEDADAIDLIGFFDDRNTRAGPLSNRIPRLGGVEDVVDYLQEHALSEVFVALPWSASERMAQLLDRLRFLPLTVRLIPDHVPPSIRGPAARRIDDVVMPTLMVPPFSGSGGFLKRLIDLTVSCALIVPLIPVFAIVGLVIRIDSRGPVFFRQARSGQFGRSFMIFKFRTLHAETSDATAEMLVTRGDSRVTRVGRFLRKYSIDELPQIINVLLGDMSLVGPRPHAPRAKANGRIYAEVLPEYVLRYRVKPGMTGWAQVNGWRGNTDTEDQLRRRVEFDFDYIGSWSVWRDLAILARTVPSMLAPPANNA